MQLLRRMLGGGGERVDMLSGLQRLHREYGNVVLQDAGLIQMINLYGPDANRFVLLDRDRIFSAKQPWNSIMGRIFPNGLLLRDGEEHRHHRKVMQEAFTRPALRQYLEHMNPMIERGTSGWYAEPKPFRAYKAFKELTLEIAASTFIGADLGPEVQRVNRVFENLVAASMSRLRLPIPGLEFHKGLKGRKFMIDYFTRMVAEKRASGSGLDMLSRLCRAKGDEGDGFGNQEIIDHMIFLMMAAHDTTTSTLSSMTYELARNRHWQTRIREDPTLHTPALHLRVRIRRLPDPEGRDGCHLPDPHPPHDRVVGRPPALRSGALLT
jgi:cytochrome P450